MNTIFAWFLQDNHYISIVGIVSLLALTTLCSTNWRAIRLRQVAIALGLQVAIALFILKTSIGIVLFDAIAAGIHALFGFAQQALTFMFGNLVQADGPWGFVFALKVLPVFIFFGALMGVLCHFGIVQCMVRVIAYGICPLLGTSGAETLSVAANTVLGQTEAPLLIKNYLSTMTDSELLTIMVSGMAHLSGSLLAAYSLMGVPVVHLLASSFIAIPSSIMIAKILIPQTEALALASSQSAVAPALRPSIHLAELGTRDDRSEVEPRATANVLDAISTGTTDGLKMAVGVGAMLISFIGLMAMVNAILIKICGCSMDFLLAKVFYWVVYFIGIPANDCQAAGALLGQKIVINEFVAYSSMVTMDLNPRSTVLVTYALAGFANISSIGIQIGGIGALCPEKRVALTRLGVKALLGGTIVSLLNAAVISLII